MSEECQEGTVGLELQVCLLSFAERRGVGECVLGKDLLIESSLKWSGERSLTRCQWLQLAWVLIMSM